MAEVSLKDLLQAGVHFGHQTHRWNPKMRKYIFAERGGIYLIDLKKTLFELERAHDLVRQTILDGKNVMFVCTKQQLAPVVRSEAERCGAFYVTERWLGGMLTNFQTIKQNIRRLKELELGAEEGAFEFYTKKERLLLERERLKRETAIRVEADRRAAMTPEQRAAEDKAKADTGRRLSQIMGMAHGLSR